MEQATIMPRTELGDRIRLCRDRLNWSQQDLAVRAGVSRQLIGLVETGRCGLSNETLAVMADVFGVTMDWLWRG